MEKTLYDLEDLSKVMWFLLQSLYSIRFKYFEGTAFVCQTPFADR